MTGSLAQLCHVVPQLPPVKYDWNCSLMGSKFRESRVCCYPASTVHGYPLLPLFRTGSSSISAFETPPSVYRGASYCPFCILYFSTVSKISSVFFFFLRYESQAHLRHASPAHSPLVSPVTSSAGTARGSHCPKPLPSRLSHKPLPGKS